ncbi:glutamine synthetase/guanido kinase [Teratosphaeria destructans]|uniref:Glutamine synthetase/guanido kinase n=1 Tax=Teratosphaeria destructans TaxID=418781 RepID=A0A9W7W117_9PEZI|nr:glutamine synthetase/guanido kinase [Teratosphaeria destructans]
MTDISSITKLKELIRTHPIIDNHAHNILRSGQLKSADFLTSTTEATGDALGDTPKSLAHIRAVRQLRSLYDLPSDADWATVMGKRAELIERDPKSLMRKCFAGIQTILVDDGLDSGFNIEPYGWHNQFTLSPCKRIVRIETVAADILSNLNQQGKLPVGVAIADEEACSLAWVTFIAEFEQAVLASLEDPEVVGFKSVICYRTGLDIQVGRDIEVSEAGLRSFRKHFLPDCNARNFRVDAKGMNDALVISTCKLIADFDKQKGISKPIQFHTGLGDNDISLLESNPAYLQLLIDSFPSVPVVLLHSSYPYTREAGYLATVYKNTYLDIGEVFPMVSRDGQEKIVRQALELTPTSKILWSTDGHHFPETYWLANVQGRAALEKVLVKYVEHEDLAVGQAAQAAKDILFENSNKLYGLNLKADSEQIDVHLPERSIDESSRVSTLSDGRSIATGTYI